MPFLGLMTVRAHEAAVADLLAEQAEQQTYWRKDTQAERETVARLVGKNANNLTTIACLKQEVAGLRSDVRQAEAAHDKAVAEIATLRPDAEKHRERVRKATMNLKQNQKREMPA